MNSLICRIQNLLPDRCNICGDEYCVKRDEISLLTCEICGLGSHNACILDQFGVLTEQDAFDPQQASEKLNPTGLPGLHYLCGACEESTIPDKGAGLLKRKSSVVASSEPDKGNSDGRKIPLRNQFEQNEVDDVIEADAQDVSDGITPAQPKNTKTEKICPFYRKGICRYGSSGRGCLNEHPRPCKKLIQHGNKAPNGYTLGRAKCDKFRPKMCHYSLSKGICQNADCKLRHVIGTKKISNETGTIEKNR